MAPVRRAGTRGDLREHGAHKDFWGRNEQRWAANFRHGRSLQEHADAFNVVREENTREETHNKVCVCVLDRDALGRQLSGERIRPSAEEGLAT